MGSWLITKPEMDVPLFRPIWYINVENWKMLQSASSLQRRKLKD